MGITMSKILRKQAGRPSVQLIEVKANFVYDLDNEFDMIDLQYIAVNEDRTLALAFDASETNYDENDRPYNCTLWRGSSIEQELYGDIYMMKIEPESTGDSFGAYIEELDEDDLYEAESFLAKLK